MRYRLLIVVATAALLLAGCAAGSAGYSPRDRGVNHDGDAGAVADRGGGSDQSAPDKGPPCGATPCDDNRPCTDDTCVSGSCAFELKPGFCLIGGACHAANTKQPGATCGVCRPVSATGAWTDDASLCGDDGRSCTAEICGQGACSHPVKAGACFIGKTCYNQGATDPQNPCQGCDHAAAPGAWSPLAAGAPCPGGACVGGACCSGCRTGGACQPGTSTAQCGKGGASCVTCTGGKTCVAGACASQSVQTLNIGPYGKTYSSASHTRGLFFTAPQDFTIVGLRVPTDVGTAAQSVEVLRLNAAPPTYPSTSTSFTSLHYSKGVAGSGWITVNIPFKSGQIVGILGGRGTTSMSSSYAASNTFTSAINGKTITLGRLLVQKNLYLQQADTFSTSAAAYSRVEVQYLAN